MRTDYLPRFGWTAGDDKIVKKRTKHEAVHYEYLEMHRSKYLRDCIIIDIDGPVSQQKLIDAGIPEPATYTGRRAACDTADFNETGFSDRPHLVWWLRYPARFPKQNMTKEALASAQKQQSFYDDVRGRLITKLESIGLNVDHNDPIVTKNPAHENWFTIVGDLSARTLSELKQDIGHVDKPVFNSDLPLNRRRNQSVFAQVSKGFRQDKALEGRASMLFESIRHLAYAYKSQASSEEDLFRYTLEQSEQFDAQNNANDPLSYSEIRSAAKSISNWTWNRYSGAGDDKDRGVCARKGLISDAMSMKQKQKIGGQYAAQKNARSTKERVLEACQEALEAGSKIVISRLAKELEISRNTLKKYMPDAAKIEALHAGRPTCRKMVKTVSIRVPTDTDRGGCDDQARFKLYKLPGAGSETWAIAANGTPVPLIWYEGLGIDADKLPDAPADLLRIARKRLPTSAKHLQGLETVMKKDPVTKPTTSSKKASPDARNLIVLNDFPAADRSDHIHWKTIKGSSMREFYESGGSFLSIF